MKMRYIISVLTAMIAFGACSTAQNYKKISAEEGNKLLKGQEKVILVDVRTKSEYETGHIPGAILIPNEEIKSTRPKELPNLDTKIIIYCRSGRRSAVAAKKLSSMGYKNILDMGGILDWPYEIEK